MKRFVFLLIPISLFSQNDIDDLKLKRSIENICEGKFLNFHKAHLFYFKEQIDSAYIYSSKASFLHKEPEIYDYLNFIYGESAYKKGFHSIAEDKLNSINSDFPFKHLVYYNLGGTSLESNKFKAALSYYEKALGFNKIKSRTKLKIIYHNTGICYLHLKNFEKAEVFLQKEIEITQQDNDTLGMLYAKLDLGNVYYEQHKDNQAIALFEEAYLLSQIHTNLTAKQITSENMAIVEKNRNNHKKSLYYLEQSLVLKDSIWNKDKISLLLEKDKQQVVAIKEKEVQIQKEQVKFQKKQSNWFLGGSIIFFSLSGLLLYFYRIKIRQNKTITTQKQQLEKVNSTKDYLLSVISHDLRSPVNLINQNNETLNDVLNHNRIQEALKLNSENITISKNTSHLLNNILNWALEQSDQLLFLPELHPINILIESILFDYKPLTLTKNIELTSISKDSDIQVFLDKELFKIAFRNLIDNAIKYTPKNGKITIETSMLNEACMIKIKDTGAGMSSDILETINNYEALTIEKMNRSKGLGLGLLLSKTLITKNNGTFRIKNNNDQGITITLVLPIKEV